MRDIGARCWKDSGARVKAVIMTKLGHLCVQEDNYSLGYGAQETIHAGRHQDKSKISLLNEEERCLSRAVLAVASKGEERRKVTEEITTVAMAGIKIH